MLPVDVPVRHETSRGRAHGGRPPGDDRACRSVRDASGSVSDMPNAGLRPRTAMRAPGYAVRT